VSVGAHDLRVSRRHGELTYQDDGWWLRNTGKRPLRLPSGRRLEPAAEPVALAVGYTPVFVRGTGRREYLVELHVADDADSAEQVPEPVRWPLSDDDRLLLVVFGQRYLRYESRPRPLPQRQALQQLRFLRPDVAWESPGIERRLAQIAARLTRGGGDGPGDATPLLHHLLRKLMDSATLVPPDLALLETDLTADRPALPPLPPTLT
jgi:hypothetical protein